MPQAHPDRTTKQSPAPERNADWQSFLVGMANGATGRIDWTSNRAVVRPSRLLGESFAAAVLPDNAPPSGFLRRRDPGAFLLGFGFAPLFPLLLPLQTRHQVLRA